MLFSRSEKLFVFFITLSAMLVMGEYSMTRSASDSLFITLFTAKAFPLVWLITIPLNFLVVYLYNRFLPKVGPLQMFAFCIAISIGIHLSTLFFVYQWPPLIFLNYAWKDIKILLMLKQLWSMIHSTIPVGRTKYLYGFLYGMGTTGAIIGSIVPSFLIEKIGTDHLFLLTLPLYLPLLFTYGAAFKYSGVPSSFQQEFPEPSPTKSFSLIWQSPYLIAILLLTVLMQVSIGLMEYKFNIYLESHILDQDLRTEYFGRLVGLMNLFSLILQFVGGGLLLHFLGLRKSHFFVPILLCFNIALSWVFPVFSMITFSFAFMKSIDFSLFGVIREMLYTPLRLDEKFRAKAIIDIFAYRSSKALASLFILALQAVAGIYLLPIVNALFFAIFLSWIAVVAIFLDKKKLAPTSF